MSTASNRDGRMLTLKVCSREETDLRLHRAFEGEAQGAILSFESPAVLFKVLTQKRWELLAAMTGAGSMSIREAARRVGRDVKAVHGDVKALLNAGLLRKTDAGEIVFPFDAVHIDFLLSAA